MTKQDDELEKLKEKIETLSNQISILSSQMQDSSRNNPKNDAHSNNSAWKLFWIGAIIGLVGGAIGSLAASFWLKLVDFQSMPPYVVVLTTIGVTAIFFLIIWVMWKLSKINPDTGLPIN